MSCFCMLHRNSKIATISKVALRRHHISKALQLFRGGTVFDVLHQWVCYFQMKVSLIVARAFSAVRGSDALFPNDFGEDLFQLYLFLLPLLLSTFTRICHSFLYGSQNSVWSMFIIFVGTETPHIIIYPYTVSVEFHLIWPPDDCPRLEFKH